MIKDDLGRNFNVIHEGDYGIEIETETKSSYAIPKFHYWDVKPDGSLRDFGQEYVLKVPVNYGNSLIEAFEEFRDKTKKIPFIQDSNSTSVHVHCNVLPETWQSVGNFLTIYTLIENLLMEVAGDTRRNNLFCLPMRSVPAINKIAIDMFKYVGKKQFNFSRIMDANTIKYAALNLATIMRFGSLEVRSFRGVTDIDVIHSWIDIFQQIRVFSRESITPPEILDNFRDKGKKYLKEILGKEWDEIRDDNEDKMIMDNLWFAGRLAYTFSPSEWKKFDMKIEKPKIPEGLSIEDLQGLAKDHYGIPFDLLMASDQIKIIQLLELRLKKRKSKSVFTGTVTDEVGLSPHDLSLPDGWGVGVPGTTET